MRCESHRATQTRATKIARRRPLHYWLYSLQTEALVSALLGAASMPTAVHCTGQARYRIGTGRVGTEYPSKYCPRFSSPVALAELRPGISPSSSNFHMLADFHRF